MPRLFALSLVLIALAAGLADARDTIDVPLRVHTIRSTVDDLNGAKVASSAVIRDRIAGINEIFGPVGIRFQADSNRVEWAHRNVPLPPKGAATKGAGRAVLEALITPESLLAPHGLDLYVVRDLSSLNLGGCYRCNAGGPGLGAAFIAAENARGGALQVRKWAHELGHALGLSHTPCTAEWADNLMMSGRCEYAKPSRTSLVPKQVERARARARQGRPAPCKH